MLPQRDITRYCPPCHGTCWQQYWGQELRCHGWQRTPGLSFGKRGEHQRDPGWISLIEISPLWNCVHRIMEDLFGRRFPAYVAFCNNPRGHSGGHRLSRGTHNVHVFSTNWHSWAKNPFPCIRPDITGVSYIHLWSWLRSVKNLNICKVFLRPSWIMWNVCIIIRRLPWITWRFCIRSIEAPVNHMALLHPLSAPISVCFKILQYCEESNTLKVWAERWRRDARRERWPMKTLPSWWSS